MAAEQGPAGGSTERRYFADDGRIAIGCRQVHRRHAVPVGGFHIGAGLDERFNRRDIIVRVKPEGAGS